MLWVAGLIALSYLGVAGPATAQLRGSPLRPQRLDELYGTRAEHFGELRGRAVLLELFGFW